MKTLSVGYCSSRAHLHNDGHSVDPDENAANIFLTQATPGSASGSRSTPSDVPKLPQIIPSNST